MLPDSRVAKMNLEFLDLVKGLNWKNKTNIKQALYINWNLSNPTCIRRENVCRNRHGVGWHGVKQTENGKKGHEIQCWITKGNGLHRCRIRQVLL